MHLIMLLFYYNNNLVRVGRGYPVFTCQMLILYGFEPSAHHMIYLLIWIQSFIYETNGHIYL